MKTRVITELFKQSNYPVLLLDENEPEWHNERYAALSSEDRDALISWSLQQSGSTHHPLSGFDFELLIAERHRILLGIPQQDRNNRRQLLRRLLPTLNAGGDPWLNCASVLGPLLGWPHCAAVKHKSADADDLLGYWHDNKLHPPRHLPLDGSLAAELYVSAEDSLFVSTPSKHYPGDPLISGNGKTVCLAQRVDTDAMQGAGYLCAWGNANTEQLALARQLLPLAADLLAAHLDQNQPSVTTDDIKVADYPSDDLTGLAGRTAFDATLETFEARYINQGRDSLMAMIDINGLSRFNADQGIEFGDKILRHFAQALKQICRPGDRVFRFGGDEFVLLLPIGKHTPPLKTRLEQIENEMKQQPGLSDFSVSMGIASLSETRGSSDDLMLLCDQRLREQKSNLNGNATSDQTHKRV